MQGIMFERKMSLFKHSHQIIGAIKLMQIGFLLQQVQTVLILRDKKSFFA